jgi:hypothetical protein
MTRCNYPRCRQPADGGAWMTKHLCEQHLAMGGVRLANAFGLRHNRPPCPVCGSPTTNVYWPLAGPVPGICDPCADAVLMPNAG